VLVGLWLQSRFRLDALRYLDCGSQPHVWLQLETAAQVRLDQNKFLGRHLPHCAHGRSAFGCRIPRGPHLLARLLVDHHRAGHEIPQPTALFVQHHADQPHAVNSGHHVDGPHQIPSNRFKWVDGAPAFFDYPNPRNSLPRRLPLPDNLEEREVSPVDGKANENRRRRTQRFGQEREYRESGRQQKKENESRYEIKCYLD